MAQIRSLKDVVARFRENQRGYVRQFRLWLVLTGAAAVADTGSTIYFMLTEGPEAEGHPAVRLISMLLGPVFGPIVGKACQFGVVFALTVYLRRYAIYIFVAVIILYAWAAWYNIWGCHLYYPRLLQWLQWLAI